MVHRKGVLDAQDFLARQLVDLGILIRYNTEVQEIQGQKKVEAVQVRNNLTRAVSTIPADGVFIAIGYLPSTDLAQKIGLELTPAGYIKQENYRTNIPGIYAAGDVTGGYNQIVTASGNGAEAALKIFEDIIHPYWKKQADAPA